MNSGEEGYLDLIRKILMQLNSRPDRTGIGTYSIFGTQLRFSLENNQIPILTTKKIFIKGVIEELLFFLRGDTDTKKLEAQGVNIWKGNTSREFLDKRGLSWLKEGSLGKGYGFQWRKFNADDEDDIKWKRMTDPIECGIDQLANVIKSLKEDPYSRRHIITAWNPSQLKDMALEPCHILMQFYVNDGKLSCQWYQRSVDVFLGLPFNIASYGLLTHILAKTVGLDPGELIFTGGDTHCYNNHIEQANIQLSREPYNFPNLYIDKQILTIGDIESLKFEDFRIENYKHHPAIPAIMAI
jgi:thymidylate synthase